MKTARPHQERAFAQLRASLARGNRRPMLRMPTGAGKTFVAAMIVRSALSRGKRIVFIVDAISLVDQTVQAFFEEGIHDVGVIQADHPMEDWSKPVQVASVQTLRRRRMPAADVVIVDEAHCQDRWLVELMASEEWANVPFVGLSATPWSKGLGNVYDDLICPVSMQELIDAGLLSPFRVFASSHPDLAGVKTVAGDYHEGQLSDVMSEAKLVGDLVETWKRCGEGRPTFAFCVDRAHAKKVQARFEEAGVPCGYIDAFTDRDERRAVRRRMDAGEIKVVANVGCLTKGVDWAIGCIILARPTKSEMLFVQMVGRGLRVNPGMPDCIILDHADNTLRMGFVTDINPVRMDTSRKGEKQSAQRKEPLPKECPSCSFVKPAKVRECPVCHFVPEPSSDIEEADGSLIEITAGQARASRHEKQSWLAQLNVIAKERGYSRGWAAQTYRKRFGVWPRLLDDTALMAPTPEVRNYVKSQLIRFVKSRKAA